MRNLSTTTAIPGPRAWLGDAPKPYIPTVDNKTFGHYRADLVEHKISLHADGIGQWTIAIDDPATEWWGVVLAVGGGAVHWFLGTSDGVHEHDGDPAWPWEAADTVRHMITWNVFRQATLNGTIGEYWY